MSSTHRMNGTSALVRRAVVAGIVLWGFTLLSASTAQAGAPEYMKLKPEVGLSLEIEGHWDSTGVFVADDIMQLPKPRNPKLRGEVQAIDQEAQTIAMYGRTIQFGADVEFISSGGPADSFKKLKAGQRLEVSCKVNDDGKWIARKVKTHHVKSSDKVKGTVTRVAVDGAAPDTLDISGLRILLVRETDIIDTEGELHEMENGLFPDVTFGRLDTESGGWPAGEAVLIRPDYRQTLSKRSEFDLTDKDTTDESSYEHDIRLEANGSFSANVAAYGQLRMRHRFLLQDEMRRGTQATLIRLTQLYAVARVPGARGMAVQIGRQDFDEPREWLFDEYQDAIRLYYYGTPSWVFEAAYIHAVEPIKIKFETWTDYYVQARWYQNPDAFAAAYVFKRKDTDVRNREPVWWGLRYYGDATPGLRPWAELAIMRGEDKGDDLSAWAIDLGTTYLFHTVRHQPRITLGYAVASGDDQNTPTTDETFRQTAYEDNVASFGGHAGFQYYGAVLDPELSNLKIWTIGAGISPYPRSSVDLVYHRYKQHRLEGDLTGSDLINPPARPNGSSDDLGWGIDLVVGFPELWNHVKAKWILGFFNPGVAFEPRQKNALVNSVNLKIGV